MHAAERFEIGEFVGSPIRAGNDVLGWWEEARSAALSVFIQKFAPVVGPEKNRAFYSRGDGLRIWRRGLSGRFFFQGGPVRGSRLMN